MKKKNRVNHSSRECINKADKQNFIEQEENAEDNKIPDPDFNSSMVYLNIYDLDAVSKVVNTVARSVGAGAFHAGVEVYGYEYSFGGKDILNRRFQTHSTDDILVKTPLTKEEVDLLVEVMKLQWIGDTYDILSRNCLNYADYFCNLLDVGSIPDWVMSLQKKVTWVKSNLNVATTKLKELNKAAGIPTVINYIKKKYNENSDDYEGFKVTVKS
ncbi:PPPDE peptidase [Plasmodium brasilianum]|uniref:PPPDE peptidase n=1 Tax=Plasmodium brasilianum TaxID=5824 RepID=A0ACB9Y9K5_PLABR|nr:PPPDE peptidase [Plasmodium brasilianum]